MFTGIVTDVGNVLSAEQRGDLRLTIGTHFDLSDLAIGASIACSGVCLTVVDKGAGEGGGWFAVDVSAETLSRTAAEHWTEGAHLNLERSLRLGDEMGGHIVTGHVDAVATVSEALAEGGSRRLELEIPSEFGPMIAAKGSIALDGVSLTINEVGLAGSGQSRFTVNVIPHTAAQTTLGDVAAGGHLNVEIDVLARYLDRMLSARSQ